ncbi:MAG: InlB B-repeat-containing protein, partial [Bacteroidales bacterium]|nr:InlB B-repeat-containing protein [Bacteroidales bacterium]
SAYEGNAANLSTMNSLQYMRVGTANPPVVNANTFSEEMYKRKTILYVPEEHFDIYVNASIWNRFAVVKDTSYFNGDLTSTKCSYYACHYKENLAGDGWESPERVKSDGYILGMSDAQPRDYEGFDFVRCEQAKLEKKDQEIPFYYSRKDFSITWKNGDETVSSGRLRYGAKIEAPNVEITAPEGYYFVGWHHKANAKIALTFDEYSQMRFETVFYAIFAQFGTQPYTVQHRQQTVDGKSYAIADTDTGYGPENDWTAATVKEYTGFTAPASVTQQKIKGDGSTVVTIDYTRNKYSVAWKKDGETYGSTSYNNKFYYGSELKIPSTPGKIAGKTFVGWNTEPLATTALDLTGKTVEGDVTYHAIYVQNAQKTYAVRHYLQNINDDNFPQLPEDTDIKTGIIGLTTEAEVKNYEGFETPSVTQVEIKANMNPIDIKYYREKYWITWMKDENTQISKTELKYGAPLNVPTSPVHEDPGKHFVGWNTDKNATTGMNVIATVSEPLTFYAIFADNGEGVYTVNHYLQNIDDDNYPATPSQSTSGADLIGRTATANALNITGFEATQSTIEKEITAATGTELNFYYT